MTPDKPETTELKPKTNEKGQWVKGVSGNPAGRPKRKYTENQIIAQNTLRDLAGMVTDQVLGRVMEGHWEATKLCFERLHPVQKESPLSIDLPPISSAQDALDALARLTDGAAKGEITLSEAERLASLVNRYLEHAHLPQLQKRLEEVERWMNANTLPDAGENA
jgi:hypothetical protein